MGFPVVRHGAVTVVNVGRELSLRSGAEIKASVAAELENGARQFVFDFKATEFIDSAGLGALISMLNIVHARDGTVRLMRLNDDMRRLLHLTKLDTLFDVVGPPAVEGELPPPDDARRPAAEQRGHAH